MTKTIEQKIADKEARLTAQREEYRKTGEKINRTVRELNKLFVERDAQRVASVMAETDPAKMDWDFFFEDSPGAPYGVDHKEAQKKLAELFGLGPERYYLIEKKRMMDYSYKFSYYTVSIRLCDSNKQSREESIAEFKHMLNVATLAVKPLGEVAPVFGESIQPSYGGKVKNIGDYIYVRLRDRDCSENGIPQLLFKPDMSSFVFVLTYRRSNYIEYQTDSLDDLIQWMYNNGKTYSW